MSEQSVHRAIFNSPGKVPQEDLATEMAINEEIDQLERRGELYTRGDRVGIKQEVAIVPSLTAIENGDLSETIKQGELAATIDRSPYESLFKVILPASLEHWASLQANHHYLTELHELDALERTNDIKLEWREVLPAEAGLMLADKNQVTNLLQGVQRKTAVDFDHTTAVETASGSLQLNYN